MSETVERNNRFYEKSNGEILTENEQLKEWLVIANESNDYFREENVRLINKEKELLREIHNKINEIERLNNKYNKALELLIDYNLPCEVDDFMNVHSDYCETHCGVDEERYKRCWNKYIEWKIGSE